MPRGPARAFDVDTALDQAVMLFWQYGYDGTSIAALTRAMGISPPSLYSAFGAKRNLFDKVMDRYARGREHYLHDALAQPTARAVATRLLRGAVEGDTQRGKPRGCLNVQAALACSPEHHDVSEALIARRAAGQALLQERFERAMADGDLPATTNCAALARYIETVVEGIAVQAKAGATPDQLGEIVELALTGFPA